MKHKQRVMSIAVTERDKQLIAEEAEKLGLSVSHFCRILIRKYLSGEKQLIDI